MSRILALVSTGFGLFGSGIQKPKEVNYDEYDGILNEVYQNQFLVPTDGAANGKHKHINKKTIQGYLTNAHKDFKGKFLDVTVKKGKKVTFMLTALGEPEEVAKTFNGTRYDRDNNFYKFGGAELPVDDKGIRGFHLLAVSKEHASDAVLFTKDKKLAEQILDDVLKECDGNGLGALEGMSWLSSDSNYSSRGSGGEYSAGYGTLIH